MQFNITYFILLISIIFSTSLYSKNEINLYNQIAGSSILSNDSSENKPAEKFIKETNNKDYIVEDTISNNEPDTSNLINIENKKSITSNSKFIIPEQEDLNTEQPGEGIVSDSVYLLDGRTIYVDVKSFSPRSMMYTEPGKMEMFKISRKKIHKIIYKSGLVEVFISIERDTPDSKSWKFIAITENSDEVQDYTKVGKVKGVANTKLFDAEVEALERSAIIIIKKNAAKLDADIVLITNKYISRQFGEPPSVTLRGIAYKTN